MLKPWIDRVARTSRRTRVIAAVATVGLGIVIWSVIAGHVVALVVISLMATVIGFLVKKAHATGKERKAKIEAARGRTRWPRQLAKTLDEHETVEHESRMYPLVMLTGKWGRWTAPLAVVFVALLVATPFVGVGLLLAAAAALAGSVVAVTPGFVNWWFTRRSFTDRRVIVITGILKRKVDTVELRRIENVNHEELLSINPILERLGLPEVWHWKFDTQVQKDPFNRLDWCFYPSSVGEILNRYAGANDGFQS